MENTNCNPQFPQPYEQQPYISPLTPEQLNYLFYQDALKRLELHYANEFESLKHSYFLQKQLEEEEFRRRREEKMAEIRRRQAEALEDLKIRRKLSQVAITEDSSGRIILEYSYPDAHVLYSKPVLSICHMQMTILICSESPSPIEVISWDGESEEVVLKECSSGKTLFKALKERGISLGIQRDMKEIVQELVYCSLKSKAQILELPASFGWNHMKNGRWHFAMPGEKTFAFYLKLITRLTP